MGGARKRTRLGVATVSSTDRALAPTGRGASKARKGVGAQRRSVATGPGGTRDASRRGPVRSQCRLPFLPPSVGAITRLDHGASFGTLLRFATTGRHSLRPVLAGAGPQRSSRQCRRRSQLGSSRSRRFGVPTEAPSVRCLSGSARLQIAQLLCDNDIKQAWTTARQGAAGEGPNVTLGTPGAAHNRPRLAPKNARRANLSWSLLPSVG